MESRQRRAGAEQAAAALQLPRAAWPGGSPAISPNSPSGRQPELLAAAAQQTPSCQPAGLSGSQLPRRPAAGTAVAARSVREKQRQLGPRRAGGGGRAPAAPVGNKVGLSSAPRSSSGPRGAANALNRKNHWPPGEWRTLSRSTGPLRGCFSVPSRARRKESLLKSSVGAGRLGRDRSSPRSPAKEGEEPPGVLPWIAGVPALASSQNIGFGIL